MVASSAATVGVPAVPHLRVDAPPAASGAAVEVLDYHTAGEPFRIIVRGYPELAGTNILERRRSALQQHDHLRKMLMWEPRGHADMYGGILVPPDHDEAQVGVLFMHNEGYSTMSSAYWADRKSWWYRGR